MKLCLCIFVNLILDNLSTIEKLCLISMLTEKFQAAAKNILVTHRKKLLHLWSRECRTSPDCVKNLSRSLTIEEDDTLRFGLDNHILP